CQHSYGSPYTF
nr:immunoglobulin light chain junction region [Macaca mulatta]